MDYKKLIEDKRNNKVCNHMTIIIDNDGGYWQCNDFDLNQKEKEKKEKEYKEKYGTPYGKGDIVEVLNAVGINSDWC